MGGHTHGLGESSGLRHRGRLLAVLGITTAVMITEVVGALVTDSLALLADAGHMLTDVAGILLAVAAVTIAARPPTADRTFGYYRLEVLAAMANALLLLAVGTYILIEAWQRWQDPPEVLGGPMLLFALVGLAANVVGMLLLRSGASESLNVRGAYLEVVGDLLGSFGVIAAAVVILLTGWDRADPLASVVVVALIVPRAWTLLSATLNVLMQGTPEGIDLAEVRRHILEVDGVVDAHDLHVWTLTSGMPVLSVHIVVADECLDRGDSDRVLDALGECLTGHFDVQHCTFQLEPTGHADHEHGQHH